MQPSSNNQRRPLWVVLVAVTCVALLRSAQAQQFEVRIDPKAHLHISVGPMHFSPDGKQFAIRYGKLIIRETATGKEVRVIENEWKDFVEAYVYSSFDWSPDGKHYVAGISVSNGKLWGMVRVWNRQSGKLVLEYRAHEGAWKDSTGAGVSSVVFSADGRYLVTNSYTGDYSDGQVQVREFPSGKLVRKFRSRSARVAISPDSKLVSDGWNIWSVATGRLLRTTRARRPSLLRFTLDGTELIVGCGGSVGWPSSGHGAIYDVKTGKRLQQLPRATRNGVSVTGWDLGVSPDCRLFALRERPSGVNVAVLRDIKAGRLLHRLTGHKRGVHSVAFSPDGKLVLTGDGERTIRFWDLKSGELLRTIVLPPFEKQEPVDRNDLYQDKDGRLRRRKR